MIKQKCRQCGKDFELSDSEIKFYKDKGLSLPKRCEECRKANRAEKEESHAADSRKTNKNGKKAGAIAAAAIIAAGVFAGHNALNNKPAEPETTPVVSELSVNDNNTNNINADTNNADTDGNNEAAMPAENNVPAETQYHFRNEKTLREHFQKHGSEFGDMYATMEEYEAGASRVINDPSALTKREKEDNDYVYYIEDTNEFVILSTDGYIRTYFKPNAGKKYYERQ